MEDMTETPPRDIGVTYKGLVIRDAISEQHVKQGSLLFKHVSAKSNQTNLLSPHLLEQRMKQYYDILFKSDGKFKKWLEYSSTLPDPTIFYWLLSMVDNGTNPYSWFKQQYNRSATSAPWNHQLAIYLNMVDSENLFFPNDPFFNPGDWELLSCVNMRIRNMYFRLQGCLLADETDNSTLMHFARLSACNMYNYWADYTSKTGIKLQPGLNLYMAFERADVKYTQTINLNIKRYTNWYDFYGATNPTVFGLTRIPLPSTMVLDFNGYISMKFVVGLENAVQISNKPAVEMRSLIENTTRVEIGSYEFSIASETNVQRIRYYTNLKTNNGISVLSNPIHIGCFERYASRNTITNTQNLVNGDSSVIASSLDRKNMLVVLCKMT